MQILDVIIFFELRTIQQKTVKPTYLCPLGARKLAEGKGHETAQTRKGEGRDVKSLTRWPRGLMDKASDFGSEDCEFESRRGRVTF